MNIKKAGELGEGRRNYLNFPSFHQRTVKLLSGPLCISARLKCYKTKALEANEERREKSSNKAEAHSIYKLISC